MELKILAYLIIFFGVVNLFRMALFLIGSDVYGLIAAKRRKKQIDFKPKVSVIIPAFNEEKTVIRAIESVLSSDYPKELLEIIVVDDGSKDNTLKTVSNFKDLNKNANIIIVTQQNQGKAWALNKGIIGHCKGELVVCLDSDSFLDKNAIKNTAFYFSDPKVMALSSNIKIIQRKGLLNLVQLYEYMISYQMKRAESLFNCSYIVGGIGSVFRRQILEKVGFYDTNTVTEDIDLTMKVLQLGNKDNKVVYGADVISYTESVLSVSDLIKQRHRWKWGRFQTFFKNKNIFFSKDNRFSKSLSWLYLPFAIYGEIAYFFEPLLLFYILAVSVYYMEPVSIISAWIVISSYIILNILAEDTISFRQKIKLVIYAPLMYALFYILSFVEYTALIKSIINLPHLRNSLNEDKYTWTPVKRPISTFANV